MYLNYVCVVCFEIFLKFFNILVKFNCKNGIVLLCYKMYIDR